jgi:hypothetical protein
LDDEKVKAYAGSVDRLDKMTRETQVLAAALLQRAFEARQQHQEALERKDALRALPLLLKAADYFKRADAIDTAPDNAEGQQAE